MATDLTDLKAAAKTVIDAFNRPVKDANGHFDYYTLLSIMDPDVVIKRVLNPGSIVGIGNVESYLNYHMGPNEAYLNYDQANWQLYPKNPTTHGEVNGTGTYHDDHGKTTATIKFTLVFARKTNKDNWALTSAIATPEQ
jgi:hypothetical protein